MEFVLKALEGIFSIVFIIGIGFVLSRRGWFDEYSSALIARLVTAVSLPLYMIVSIRFVRYEDAPPAVQEKAIEAAKAMQEEAD